jgi:hypothetical protein
VIAVSVAGFEKNIPHFVLGFNKRKVKHKATNILVRIVKKLKNRIIVSGIETVRLTIISQS